MKSAQSPGIEATMRRALAQGDRALASIAPVLSHLLAAPGQSLVSDDLLARMRGMLRDIARQLVAAQRQAQGIRHHHSPDEGQIDALAERLAGSATLLSHCYALAMEGLVSGQLEQRAGIDPVLSPLMQELIASNDEDRAGLAMSAMAAQARFLQAHRRMHLAMTDLTADLFHEALQIWSGHARAQGPEALAMAVNRLREGYNEASSRPGLLARLVGTMRAGTKVALMVEHAGFALFVTSLATITRQPRELVVLACHEQQASRLALSLCAAGLDAPEVARQMSILHTDFTLPGGFAGLGQRQAIELLGSAPMKDRG